jgi:putative transposase
MSHGKFREAFLQGEEKDAANLFRHLLRQSIRIGLLEAMKEEVEALSGPRYHPQSPCHRAGSESGIVYMDGGR